MIELLITLMWSGVYILICFYCIRHWNEKRIYMPYLSGCLNIAWEAVAVFASKGYWGHILWIALDLIIFSYNVSTIKKRALKIAYCCFTGFVICALAFIFEFASGGMLISVFTIDLIMAVEFIYAAKLVQKRGKITIAALKLMGDLAAWISYMQDSLYVAVIGVVVTLLNLFYLAFCLEEYTTWR